MGVAEESGARGGGSGGVDAGDDEVSEGVYFCLGDDSVALEVLSESLAGGDVHEVVDGGESVRETLLGQLGGGGTDVGDVAHKAGEGVDAGDGGDLGDVDKVGDFADVAIWGAGAKDKDQGDSVIVGFARQAGVAGGREEVEQLAVGAAVVGVTKAEVAGSVGEDVGSASVGYCGRSGGFDQRDAGSSVAYVIGGKEIDVGVADWL